MCVVASSALSVCGPEPQSEGTTTVSVKVPFTSISITAAPAASTTGILVSRVKPARPRGVKFLPCSVIIVPTATLLGETCSESSLALSAAGEKTSCPRVVTTPKMPLKISTIVIPKVAQKKRAGGRVRRWDCGVNITGRKVRGRGEEMTGDKTGEESNFLCHVGGRSEPFCSISPLLEGGVNGSCETGVVVKPKRRRREARTVAGRLLPLC